MGVHVSLHSRLRSARVDLVVGEKIREGKNNVEVAVVVVVRVGFFKWSWELRELK